MKLKNAINDFKTKGVLTLFAAEIRRILNDSSTDEMDKLSLI